jgi:hypothetical protein
MLDGVSRIEWTRLQGDDVEAVIAMFVNRERPNSTRITPSRGDGGVDILDRGGASGGRDAVHQVKRYTNPLDKKQKDEVEKSLDALAGDARWKDLDVSEWHLDTPWDPTPEAETWLQGLAKARALKAVWHGLTWADQLAAKYGDVVDYYLRGGRNRIEETYATVLGLLALERTEQNVDVATIVGRIQAALPALDSDPHYRYELRFGEGDYTDGYTRQGIVMTQVTGRDGGAWAAVDIIARCAASTQIRPITINGTFTAQAGTEFEKDLRGFIDFGAPFTSPTGAYNGDIDAPGGLGGKIVDALVKTLPVDQGAGANPDLHVQILDPDGDVIASADVERVEVSGGREGLRVLLKEVNGAFTLEERRFVRAGKSTRQITLGGLAGRPVQVVQRALEFLLACVTPNSARISIRHTPPELGVPDPNWNFLDLMLDASSALAREKSAVDALVTIQARSRVPIAVPDLSKTPVAHIREWLTVAELLNAGEASASYPEGQSLVLEVGPEVELPSGPFGIMVPLGVTVGAERLELGQVEVWLDDPTIVTHAERDDRVFYAITTADRSYRYRL